MNDFAVWPCANPSLARSGSWRPHAIPRGPPSKPLEFLVFLRGRPWNSIGGHSAQDADLINSTKILLIHWGPYKTKGK